MTTVQPNDPLDRPGPDEGTYVIRLTRGQVEGISAVARRELVARLRYAGVFTQTHPDGTYVILGQGRLPDDLLEALPPDAQITVAT